MTLCECIALLSCFSRAEDGGDLTEFDRPQVRTPSGKAAVASGVVDFENAQPAKESDLYPWGSACAEPKGRWRVQSVCAHGLYGESVGRRELK